MTELSGWTRKLQSTSQSQTCTKNGHSHCLLVCNLSDPLQLSESWWNPYIWEVCKSMRCTENWNACNWHWSTERTQFFSMITPNRTLHNWCFKSWTNWGTKLCFICHIHLTSHQLTTTSSSISTTFCRENGSTNQQEAENAFEEFVKSWSMDFHTTGINKLIPSWKKCVDCNGFYFD